MTGSLASCLDPAPQTPYSFVIVPQLQESTMSSTKHCTWPLLSWKKHSVIYLDVSSRGLFANLASRSSWCGSHRTHIKMPEAEWVLVATWEMSSVWKWVFTKLRSPAKISVPWVSHPEEEITSRAAGAPCSPVQAKPGPQPYLICIACNAMTKLWSTGYVVSPPRTKSTSKISWRKCSLMIWQRYSAPTDSDSMGMWNVAMVGWRKSRNSVLQKIVAVAALRKPAQKWVIGLVGIN